MHFAATMAHENARSLRHLISLELWSQLNIFYNALTSLDREQVGLSRLSGVCAWIKEGCQLHTGIAEGTLLPRSGVVLLFLGQGVGAGGPGHPVARCEVYAAAAGACPARFGDGRQPVEHAAAFRRWLARLPARAPSRHEAGRHRRSFLLFNRAFPRSVNACVAQLRELLFVLVNVFGLDRLRPVAEATTLLDRDLGLTDSSRIVAGSVHDFVNDLQLRFQELTSDLGTAVFFAEPSLSASQAQSQTQTSSGTQTQSQG